MRLVKVDKNRTAEVPTTWIEAERMLAHASSAYFEARGRNLARLSIAARAMHGMFGGDLMSPDPTTTLLYLLQRIAIRKGAGLNNLKPSNSVSVSRSRSIEVLRLKENSDDRA